MGVMRRIKGRIRRLLRDRPTDDAQKKDESVPIGLCVAVPCEVATGRESIKLWWGFERVALGERVETRLPILVKALEARP